jgi:hypothetical protein
LSAVWTHFRRLVASLMLVAMTSFVLHGGAMAGVHQHGMGSTECAPPASAGHIHQAAAHDHSAAHSHQPEHDHGEVSSPSRGTEVGRYGIGDARETSLLRPASVPWP